MKTHNSFKALISELNKSVEKPEKGYKTTNQFAKEWGLSRGQASSYIRKGLAAGIIEKKKFRIEQSNYTTPVFHYKLLTK